MPCTPSAKLTPTFATSNHDTQIPSRVGRLSLSVGGERSQRNTYILDRVWHTFVRRRLSLSQSWRGADFAAANARLRDGRVRHPAPTPASRPGLSHVHAPRASSIHPPCLRRIGRARPPPKHAPQPRARRASSTVPCSRFLAGGARQWGARTRSSFASRSRSNSHAIS